MSDSDMGSSAWQTTPSDYLKLRPPAYELPQAPWSVYLAMRDGCRLAVDIYLPQETDQSDSRSFPILCLFTPYYRRFKLKDGATGVEPSPNAGKYRDFFVPRGYALVVVDVRGTGASFGTRDSFRSPKERDDCREVVEWVVSQPWSNGSVGATGVSYVGAACDFLASCGHPAVKAVAPLFAVWDTYSDHYYPGGLFLNRLAKTYDRLMVALDHDERDLLREFAYFKDPNFEGPQPVDEDEDGTLAAEAVREHLGNFRMPDFITEFQFKDSTLPYDPEFTSAQFSPYRYRDGIPSDVAILSVSGWLDGAGYANGAIARHLTLKDNPRHLLLGPWDHGARCNVSPWRSGEEAEFSLLAEVLRFFDHYLMGCDTGLDREDPVHYFNLHGESWLSATSWPPFDETTTFYLADDALVPEQVCPGEHVFAADPSAGTGQWTRYERLAAIDCRQYYANWAVHEATMMRMSSEPLTGDMEFSGHAVADLWITSSERDVALFVYLSEVEADGSLRYVTEGMLRALHRKEKPCPEYHRTSWPYRSFSQGDARPLVPGEPARLRFALLPTSWTFREGSRIRLSFAGADADHYAQVPHGCPPHITVLCGGSHSSCIELPLRARKPGQFARKGEEENETLETAHM